MTDLKLPEVLAFSFDGHGGATVIEAAAAVVSGTEAEFRWLHLHHSPPETESRLKLCGLDPLVVEALVAEETRPRCTVHGSGAVINLRGVNLSPGAEAEDMVSVRLWVEQGRVIGVWRRPLMAVADLVESIRRQQAPTSPGDFIAKLALRLADRAEPTVAELNERVDALEEQALGDGMNLSRGELADIRRTAIVLRRYMVPQRDALTTLEIEDLGWLEDRDRARLREAAERVTRLGEDLDAIRDRSQVVHDQMMDQRAEQMNRNMLVLSVVAAIFLPLGLLTGLLGINVGGIPGTDYGGAFAIVCGLLVAIVLVQLWLFRRFGIIR